MADDPTPEEIAAWALWSYRGDASFFVHDTPLPGGLAGSMLQSMKAHFIQRPFIAALSHAIAKQRGEVAISVDSQELAGDLFVGHAEEFLKAMYIAHDRGKIPFESCEDAVPNWVALHISIP